MAGLVPHVQGASSRLLSDSWVPEWYRDPYWRVYGNMDSGAWLIHPGGKCALLPNEIMIVPGWLRFRGRLDRPVVHRWLHFSISQCSVPLLRRNCTQVLVLRRKDQAFGLLSDVLAMVAKRCDDQKGALDWSLSEQCRLQAGAHLALAEYFRQFPAMTLRDPHGLTKLLRYIEENPRADLRLEALARLQGCTEGHLSRVFTSSFGQSISSYVRECRVFSAADLLAQDELSIEQVAEASGFSDRYHFSRVFKKLMHRGPAAFRRQNRLWLGA